MGKVKGAKINLSQDDVNAINYSVIRKFVETVKSMDNSCKSKNNRILEEIYCFMN